MLNGLLKILNCTFVTQGVGEEIHFKETAHLFQFFVRFRTDKFFRSVPESGDLSPGWGLQNL